MCKWLVLRVMISMLLLWGVSIPMTSGQTEEGHKAYVAGAFYPADKTELNLMIDEFLKKTETPDKDYPDISAIIVPHAGYIYSAQTAAYAYRLLEGREYDTVVLLGPCHRSFFNGASVWNGGEWETPFGNIPVDMAMAEGIRSEDKSFQISKAAHLGEHSLEVQLPFLKKVMKDFKIVPILLDDTRLENCRLLAGSIAKHSQGKKVLVVASTDMSHFYPDKVARQMDKNTLEVLKEKNTESMLRILESKKGEFCGGAAVLTALEAASLFGADELEVLKYTNSADITGDKSRVVGYSASVIYKKNTTTFMNKIEKQEYNLDQRNELLNIAKKTIESYVRTGKVPDFKVKDPLFREKRAVFVTLRRKGALRGCIGRIYPEESLYLAVRNMAVESSSRDPRFRPVQLEELKDLDISISVLGLPKRVSNADEIVMGKHGVILRKGHRSGVFLPTVATETGWSKEEFLGELCSQKAGLSSDCWKDKSTELYIFTSEDFEIAS